MKIMTATASMEPDTFYWPAEDSEFLHDLRKEFISITEAYQRAHTVALHLNADWVIYRHDDIIIDDPFWCDKLKRTIEILPNAGVIGLGGALSLGHPDIYKVPYQKSQLARYGYASNTWDAEAHGQRRIGIWPVAVVDGFFMAIRTSMIEAAGGWPVNNLTFHGYDTWACLEAARQGYRVYANALSCIHYGGRTSTSPAYAAYLESKEPGLTDQIIHDRAHEWLYNSYRNELPIHVTY